MFGCHIVKNLDVDLPLLAGCTPHQTVWMISWISLDCPISSYRDQDQNFRLRVAFLSPTSRSSSCPWGASTNYSQLSQTLSYSAMAEAAFPSDLDYKAATTATLPRLSGGKPKKHGHASWNTLSSLPRYSTDISSWIRYLNQL